MTPRAEVLFSPGAFISRSSTAVDYVYFQTYDTERGTNQASEIKANVDLGRLQPYVSIRRREHARALQQRNRHTRRHHDRTYSGGVGLKVASRTMISARRAADRRPTSTRAAEFRGEDLAVALDNSLDGVDGTFGMQLTPLTSVSLVVSQEWQRFDLVARAGLRHHLRITPTVTFSPGGLLTGSAAIGYRRFNGRSAELPDFSGLVAIVNVGATILGRHRLDTSFAPRSSLLLRGRHAVLSVHRRHRDADDRR